MSSDFRPTLCTVCNTIIDDAAGIGARAASLHSAITNTISEVGISAETAGVRLAVHVWAAELTGLCEHVVDAGLLVGH